MRHLELVVDYLAGDELTDPDQQYGAVFRVTEAPEIEAAFAAAEPPTHDDWNIQHLTGTQKGVVRDARTFIRERMSAFVNPAGIQAGSDSNVPLAGLARSLAGILPSGGGDGAEGQPGGGGGGGGSGGASGRVRVAGAPRLVLRGDEALVAQSVVFAPSSHPVHAIALASVAVDGGREKVAPSGAASPEVVGWEADDGTWHEADEISVLADAPRSWTVFVRPAPDTSTVVRVGEVRP
jgi:hypothetical protein